MSLLSLNELCIVIHPERVVLLHAAKVPTLRGFKRRVLARTQVPCEASGEDAPWSGAIRTLATSLPYFAKRNMRVTVILSNRFICYALVPWCDNLSGADEEMAYARHCFGDVYGDEADAWELRLSPNSAGAPALASAVDKRLLEELRGLFAGVRVDVRSIQPHVMTACNILQASLSGRSAWLALLEPGNLCLGMLQKGQWTWLRKMRIGEIWQEELPMILEREACLSGADAELDEVLVWAPHLHDGSGEAWVPPGHRWKFRHLKAGYKHGFRLEHDGLLGMAEVG